MPDMTVRPFLMFQGQGAEAVAFYCALFPGARLLERQDWGSGEPGREGTLKRAVLILGDQAVICTDSPIQHAFSFTPSFSLFVNFTDEAELRRIHQALKDGGSELMPIGGYGFSRLFAWVSDRFGVSWQLNLQ